jgi:hypothetical protein
VRTRLLIGAVGVAMGLFGALRLLQVGFADLVDAVLWLGGGVLVHDAVLAPLTIAVTWLGARLVPERWRSRVVVAAVVLATVTVAAVPVLGRFGARPDNPTLLDRHYWWGWLAIVVLVLLGVLLSGLVTRRRRQAPPA